MNKGSFKVTHDTGVFEIKEIPAADEDDAYHDLFVDMQQSAKFLSFAFLTSTNFEEVFRKLVSVANNHDADIFDFITTLFHPMSSAAFLILKYYDIYLNDYDDEDEEVDSENVLTMPESPVRH